MTARGVEAGRGAGRTAARVQALVDAVGEVVAGRPDLLRPEYAAKVARGADPLTGHCYVATEALWHLLGGSRSGWRPFSGRGPGRAGGSHWWLVGPGGEVADVTARQFDRPVDYAAGTGRGFLTRRPSARAREVIRAVRAAEHGA